MLSERQKIASKLVKFSSDKLVKKGYNPDEIIERLKEIKDTGENYGGYILNWFSWSRNNFDSQIVEILSILFTLKAGYDFCVRMTNENAKYFTIGCQELTGIDKLESFLNGEITELQLSEFVLLKRSGKSIFSYFHGEKNIVRIREARKIAEIYKKLNSYLTNQTD